MGKQNQTMTVPTWLPGTLSGQFRARRPRFGPHRLMKPVFGVTKTQSMHARLVNGSANSLVKRSLLYRYGSQWSVLDVTVQQLISREFLPDLWDMVREL
jgi:hypothetical protein